MKNDKTNPIESTNVPAVEGPTALAVESKTDPNDLPIAYFFSVRRLVASFGFVVFRALSCICCSLRPLRLGGEHQICKSEPVTIPQTIATR
jgi:hypothetical protein